MSRAFIGAAAFALAVVAGSAAAQGTTDSTDSAGAKKAHVAKKTETKVGKKTATSATETQADLLKKAKISMDSARAIALAKVPGATVESSEIEREHGRLIYSFDL